MELNSFATVGINETTRVNDEDDDEDDDVDDEAVKDAVDRELGVAAANDEDDEAEEKTSGERLFASANGDGSTADEGGKEEENWAGKICSIHHST